MLGGVDPDFTFSRRPCSCILSSVFRLREWAGKPTTSVVGVCQGCQAYLESEYQKPGLQYGHWQDMIWDTLSCWNSV